jgi:predicted NAD/FAD-dependent oxidoreductase
VTSIHVQQYAQGMPVFHPGLTWEQEENLMPMFNERIILAGDYVQGSPTVEGALESGWYAGGKVADVL